MAFIMKYKVQNIKEKIQLLSEGKCDIICYKMVSYTD